MTVLIPEEQIVANIEQALDDQVLKEPTGVNRFQAARRLRALGSVGDTDIPIGEVTPATPFYWLVSNWLDFTGADINSFWGLISQRYRCTFRFGSFHGYQRACTFNERYQ